MRILLTGTSGFIGKHLVPLLSHHQLWLLGRKKTHFHFSKNQTFLEIDLENTEQLRNKLRDITPDICIHLAWDRLPDYSLSNCLKNFEAGVRLFEILGATGCKKIFVAGSCWEYGDLQGQVSEADYPKNMNLFASYKTGLRLIGQSLAASNQIDFIWGRIFFVYGVGQRESSLIPYCYKTLKGNKTPRVNNPSAINDFIHVSDVANAIKALIETHNISGVFNIGSGKPSKIGKIVELVAKIMGSKRIPKCYSEYSEGKGIWADISLIQKKTGWSPQIPLETGIEKTLSQIDKKGKLIL